MANVAREVKELARQMARNPNQYRVYLNKQAPRLPVIAKKHKNSWRYIEGTVEMGQAQGRGQYRVVCLVDRTDEARPKVMKKYYTPNHYGTGSDARKKPVWYPFR